ADAPGLLPDQHGARADRRPAGAGRGARRGPPGRRGARRRRARAARRRAGAVPPQDHPDAALGVLQRRRLHRAEVEGGRGDPAGAPGRAAAEPGGPRPGQGPLNGRGGRGAAAMSEPSTRPCPETGTGSWRARAAPWVAVLALTATLTALTTWQALVRYREFRTGWSWDLAYYNQWYWALLFGDGVLTVRPIA